MSRHSPTLRPAARRGGFAVAAVHHARTVPRGGAHPASLFLIRRHHKSNKKLIFLSKVSSFPSSSEGRRPRRGGLAASRSAPGDHRTARHAGRKRKLFAFAFFVSFLRERSRKQLPCVKKGMAVVREPQFYFRLGEVSRREGEGVGGG